MRKIAIVPPLILVVLLWGQQETRGEKPSRFIAVGQPVDFSGVELEVTKCVIGRVEGYWQYNAVGNVPVKIALKVTPEYIKTIRGISEEEYLVFILKIRNNTRGEVINYPGDFLGILEDDTGNRYERYTSMYLSDGGLAGLGRLYGDTPKTRIKPGEEITEVFSYKIDLPFKSVRYLVLSLYTSSLDRPQLGTLKIKVTPESIGRVPVANPSGEMLAFLKGKEPASPPEAPLKEVRELPLTLRNDDLFVQLLEIKIGKVLSQSEGESARDVLMFAFYIKNLSKDRLTVLEVSQGRLKDNLGKRYRYYRMPNVPYRGRVLRNVGGTREIEPLMRKQPLMPGADAYTLDLFRTPSPSVDYLIYETFGQRLKIDTASIPRVRWVNQGAGTPPHVEPTPTPALTPAPAPVREKPPLPNRLIVADGFNSRSRDHIILVHGFGSWPGTFERFLNWMKMDYSTFDVQLYSYHWEDEIALSARYLAYFLERDFRPGRDNLYLIGHSMGGLVVKEALASSNPRVDRRMIKKIIYIGTPHDGVLATKAQAIEIAKIYLGDKFVPRHFTHEKRQKPVLCYPELARGSSALNLTYYRDRSYVIVGTSPRGMSVVKIVGDVEMKGPHDGLVPVSSACGVKNGPNITSGSHYKELALNHFELIQTGDGYLALRECLGRLPLQERGETMRQQKTLLPRVTPRKVNPALTPAPRRMLPKPSREEQLEKLGGRLLERFLEKALK